MKLIIDGVWSVSGIHLRILRTAEKCMRNHVTILSDVLKTTSNVRGNFSEYVMDLCKLKLLSYWGNGYKLTCSGHDCLAIDVLKQRGLEAMGERIGIGKESDVYLGMYKGKEVVLKFHRLGRTSFRTVKKNRNYVTGRSNWFSLCKVSCKREVNYLEMFKDMSVPAVIDYDRHVMVQELLDYRPLYSTKVEDVGGIFNLMMNFVKDLWNRGYVHGDFNEFNVMVKDDIKVIDFPQCIEKKDDRASDYLRRDIYNIALYFKKKYGYCSGEDYYTSLAERMDVTNEFFREMGSLDILNDG